MRCAVPTLLVALGMLFPPFADVRAEDETGFFETRIRPVLVEHCYKCHSDRSRSPKGGLRVDSRPALLRGGESGPALIPGKPSESLLLRAMLHEGDISEMPPDEKMPERVLDDFRRWIAAGAVDPRQEQVTGARGEAAKPVPAQDFWAFQPPRDTVPPRPRDAAWPTDALDQFVLAPLEAKGLHPAPDADRHTWLRRVALDLVGLPPTPVEIAAFVRDASPRAKERVVDRLLASPAFGERWARHWLDLTGFADQIGTSNDIFAEHAWRYRNYVIDAFNADTPFDQFIREQIAGDLLSASTLGERVRNLVATGFLVLGDLPIVEADKAKLRVDVVDQQVDKVGKAFLGLTLGCARCHDHKFDPILLQDYYGMAGIFASTESVGKAEWGVWSWPMVTKLPETPEEQNSRQARTAAHAYELVKRKAERDALPKRIEALAARLQATGPAAPANRSALEVEKRELEGRLGALNRDIEHAEFFTPGPPAAFAVHDAPKPGNMRITIRGNAHALGAEVPRGFVRVVGTDRRQEIPTGESGRRQLADWIASKDNPLTARVAVNRAWRQLFGEGIVRSVDYFGARGERPTHPELLDALAVQFMEQGWSTKRLIRRLVLSRTYGMSSAHDRAGHAADPDNRLLWRMNRRRLDAESLRDAMLAVSGTRLASRTGPSLPLEYPENTGGLRKGDVNPPSFRLARFRPEHEFVRTVYLPIIRSAPQVGPAEVRNVFDFTQPGEVAGARNVTSVPTQSLFLLNADFMKRRAGELAQRIMEGTREEDRLEALWLLVLNRPITTPERTDASAFLSELEAARDSAPSARARAAWAELCHSLLASNEFLLRL